VPRADTILIAGSHFGGPTEPLWVANIEANPDVSVRMKGRTTPMTARRLEGAGRAEAWAHMTAVWPNFAKYEERTDREIKVFELRRA
jgi:deazaflavin-dependent oxidoreductase (nitroreductase family)